MIVVGVDPGTIKTGYGVVRKDGSRLIRIDSGVIRLNEKTPLEDRLPVLFDSLHRVLTANGPDEGAIESLFFAKNASSALKLGHARGVIVLCLKQRNLNIASYAPTFVKRAIVGTGAAPKGQMQKVVQAILGLKSPLQEDEADALAIAICHLNAPPGISHLSK